MNLTFPVALTLIALHTAQVGATDVADEAQRVFAKVSPSVVTIKTFDAKGAPEAQGSGVVVGVGLIASNCHVIEDAASIRVIAAQGELVAEWTRRLPGLDLCLLKVDKLQAASLVLRATNSLKVGEPIFAIGNPLGFGLAVSKGLIAVLKQSEPYPLIVATAPQSPGSSGGGLFDTDGRLIGITTAVMGTGQNLNLILAADGITTLIEKGAPRSAIPLAPLPERVWQNEAEVLQKNSNWPALEKLALDWSRAQTMSARPLAYLGMAQETLNRHAEAESTLRKALVLDEHHAFAWLNLATVLNSLGRHKEAEHALQQAERLMPNHADPSRFRAEWFKKQAKPAEALLQINESIRKSPGRSYVWNLLGEIEDSLGHNEAAIQAFSTSLRLIRANAEAQRSSARLANSSINVDETARLQALQDTANDDESRVQLAIGQIEKKRGRLAQAEKAIRAAISLSPKS